MADICIRLLGLKGFKDFLSKSPMSRAWIFKMLHHVIDIYQNCSYYAPGVKNEYPGKYMFT